MANPIQSLITYLKASIEELKKVAWPTKAETFRYSALVIGITLALALAIGVFDYALTLGLETLLVGNKPAPAYNAPTTETPSPNIQVEPINIQTESGNVPDIQVETAPVVE